MWHNGWYKCLYTCVHCVELEQKMICYILEHHTSVTYFSIFFTAHSLHSNTQCLCLCFAFFSSVFSSTILQCTKLDSTWRAISEISLLSFQKNNYWRKISLIFSVSLFFSSFLSFTFTFFHSTFFSFKHI